jgi:small-conductance mechanosensitive channel
MGDLTEVVSGLGDAASSLGRELSSVWVPIQLALILCAAALAAAVAALVRMRIDLVALTMGWPATLRLIVRTVIANLGMIIFAAFVASLRAAMLALTLPSRSSLLGVATSLAVAWVVIHLIAGLIRNRFVFRVVALSAWTIAALSIVGLLGPLSEALDSVAIDLGGLRLSPLLVLKTLGLLLVALWAAIAISNFLDKRVRRTNDLTPSHQVLIGKLLRLSLITIAVLLVLRSAGIDLSALAIFSGAVGVGIGFGLQKIVSNFFSGIILLADKSIKPGDVITVGDSFGWVSSMNTRFIAVVTRDGREVLIPNEDLVTQRVVNWSYTKDDIRVDVEFGVDIASNPHAVRRVAAEAAASVPRVLEKPAPVCHFISFGARSLDFVLRFWINDPADGVTNIRGAVLLALWDALKRENIEFPSPVQELRLRQSAHVVVDKLEQERSNVARAGGGRG